MTVDELLTILTRRFSGVDLQYRRVFTHVAGQAQIGSPAIDWPGAWRARLVTSKNERADYRITVFGDTPERALELLVAEVKRVDEAGKVSGARPIVVRHICTKHGEFWPDDAVRERGCPRCHGRLPTDLERTK